MQTEYELTNFKAFARSGSIALRPITLIYGPNSSGKSSLLQSLLLLKQTLEESENPETLLLPKGNLVDLGGYREFVYRHETERPFSVKWVQPISIPAAQTDLFPGAAVEIREIAHRFDVGRVGLRITFAYDQKATNASVREFAFFVNDDATPIATFEARPFEPKDIERAGSRVALLRGRPATVYRGTDINVGNPFWRRLAEAERELAKRSAEDLEQNIAQLKRQLKKVEDLEAAAARADVDPARRQRATQRAARAIPERQALVDQLRALEQQLRLAQRPVDQLLASFVELHSRTYFVARNFLPGEVDILPQEEDDLSFRVAIRRHYYRAFGYGYAAGAAARLYTLAGQLMRQALADLVYLGPLRESPERHYVFSGNVTGQVGKTGRLVPDVLFKNRDLLERVNAQLTAFNIDYDVVIAGATSGEMNDVFSIRLLDRLTKVNSSILDVGFGISQVLPIIVQSMLSNSKTLCIEQPEIHLHPRLQAELGSLLVSCIQAPYNNRFIVETHSQHLILRLQRLIRQGLLKHTDLAVLYVDKTADGSHCLELRLDQAGDFIDDWPGGFFEEGYREIFAQ